MSSSAVSALLLSVATLGGEPRGVVLDFGAPRCYYCQQMEPVVDRLARQGYSIRKVDVDREPEMAKRYNVTNLPTFILVVDGREVTRKVGATSEEHLLRLLGQIPVDPPVSRTAPASSTPAQQPAADEQTRGEVLDFGASWCHYCQQMEPVVDRLTRQGYSIRKVDADREPDMVKRYGVTNLPTFILVVDGREVAREVGATSEEQLLRLLSQIPADPPVSGIPTESNTPAQQFAASDPRPSRTVELAGIDPGQPVRMPDGAPSRMASPSRRADAARPSEKESSGLLGKLFGRRRQPAVIDTSDAVVRGNIDNAPDTPQSLLPVRNPLQASVRIHVTVADQTNVGSGTAIDSRPGRTLIMTCGHLFAGWSEQSKIEVDLFLDGEVQRFVGRMVTFDLEADLGLVAIPTDIVLATAQVPDVAGRPQQGDAVVSIGCNGGASPAQERVQVTALNYYEGPDNIECTGVPVQGRSGGGLFNAEGQLMGVCIAADAERQRGAYAGLLAMHDLLDGVGLTALYRPSSGDASAEAVVAAGSRPRELASEAELAMTSAQAGSDAEVICIIRSRNVPDAPSRVVVIDRASEDLLKSLDAEMQRQQATVQAQRVAPQTRRTDFQSVRPADPDLVPAMHPVPTSRFESFNSYGLETRPTGERSRSSSLRPTALSKPVRPQRYVRSANARLSGVGQVYNLPE